ncbi:MAG: DUF6456 domain-containing protein [Pseudomonadota bacterium]
MPDWVPPAARNYVLHTEVGHSIRALARAEACHASTVLRQIRRLESRRDDLLIDEALMVIGKATETRGTEMDADQADVLSAEGSATGLPNDADVEREARRILRRLCETGAVLAVAREMEKAVVVREMPDGRTVRTGVVDRPVAQAMALKDWIGCKSNGRIARYRITQAGRSALQRLLSSDPDAHHGFAEAPAHFSDQHRVWGEKKVAEPGEDKPKRVRYNVAESPIALLARRRDKDGRAFLNDDLVRAGERLREDFELAAMGPRVAQNWERFLIGGDRGSFQPGANIGQGPEAARSRVMDALKDLGPGLGDVALRCCCFLEGLETTERKMGWSARSGKIVLRIALERLRRHYEESMDGKSPLIG